MKSFLILMALLCATPALADVEYIVLKSGTIAVGAADSSGVVRPVGAKRMWLNIINTKLSYSDIGALARDTTLVHNLADGKVVGSPGQSYAYAKMDSIGAAYADSIYLVDRATTLTLAVQARAVLPLWTTSEANYRTTSASTYSDSTYVPWLRSKTAGTVAADSLSYNSVAPTATTPGSSELLVIIKPSTGAALLHRVVHVPLEGFLAEYASFRWRLLDGSNNGKARLRVILCYEK